VQALTPPGANLLYTESVSRVAAVHPAGA
jgi:hypothetical protein